jgi:hypothetical protein
MIATSDALVTQVRLLARLPSGSEALSDSEILLLADEVQQTVIAPAIRKIRENYGLKSKFITAPFTATLTDGQPAASRLDTTGYRIPYRAQGGSLYDVTFINSEDDEISVDYIPIEDRALFEGRGHPYTASGMGYTIEGDRLILLHSDNLAAGTLRMRYYLRPSSLVAVSSCYSVTSISATYRYNGSHGSLFTTSSVVDVVESRPNYDVLLMDKTPSAVAAGYVTLDELADAQGVDQSERSLSAPYMYVCPAGSSCVLSCPPECHTALASLVAGRALMVLGFPEQSQTWTGYGMSELDSALGTMNPRTQSEPGKVVNWTGPLRKRR